jgi:hypothetical protein
MLMSADRTKYAFSGRMSLSAIRSRPDETTDQTAAPAAKADQQSHILSCLNLGAENLGRRNKMNTVGSPISKTIEPFTNSDYISAFVNGIFWGAAVWGLVAVGAWLVMVMRQRPNPSLGLLPSTGT